MAKLSEDTFDVFDDPTPPRADQAPAETTAPPSRTPRPSGPANTHTVAEAPAEMDKDVLERWQWQLGATARKAAAAQRRAREAVQAWERLVADARDAGVPDRLPMVAALEADIDLPANT